MIFTILGRTDLRISLSKAKFDEEVDFEVRSAVALQNSIQKLAKNQNFDPKFSPIFFCRRRKMKRPESSETRFGKVLHQSEPRTKSYFPLASAFSI